MRPPAPAVLRQGVSQTLAWRREDFDPERLSIELTEPALKELRSLACDPAIYSGAIEDFAPDPARFRETLRIMAALRHQLDHGTGFAVLDRLPVEEWDERQSSAIVFLVSSILGPVMRQKWKGARLYHVRDTGKALGYGVRRSVTNLQQDFHTDGAWLEQTPDVIGLACLRQATSGGVSGVASLATAHDVLGEREPELLARLYREFWWDRQAEHAPGEFRSSRRPVYAWDGQRLSCRYYDDYVRNGQKLAGAPLDIMGDEALEAMGSILAAPENNCEFRLQQGQIEYVNNRLVAHARTAFKDTGGPEAKRHLLRIWVRRGGGIGLEPETASVS